MFRIYDWTNGGRVYDHQGAMELFWLHFCGAVMSTIFIYSLWYESTQCSSGTHLTGILLRRTCWRGLQVKCLARSFPDWARVWTGAASLLHTDRTAAVCQRYSGRRTRSRSLVERKNTKSNCVWASQRTDSDEWWTSVSCTLPLKASVAPGAWFLSGWNFKASFLYDRFSSSSGASFWTPRIS